MSEKLLLLLKDPVSRSLALLAGAGFVVLYLLSIEHLTFAVNGLSFSLSEDWPEKLFRQRVPFLWEPIAALTLGPVTLFLSPPNILLGLLLGLLVGLNVLVSAFSSRKPQLCSLRKPYHGFLGFLPASLTGFACCAPTFLLALGPLAFSGLTLFFIEIRPLLIPLSVLLMAGSLVWTLRRIPLRRLQQG